MKFEALNFKKKFKVCKLVCFCGLIYMIINGLPLVGDTYMPSWNPGVSDWADIGGYNSKYQAEVTLAKMTPVLIFSVGIAFAVFAVLFHKWEKDAKRYGLSIDGNKVHILCEGQTACLDAKDIDRFEVLPKNCEPQLKAKWTEVCYIVSGERAYKLYYLSKLQEAKILVESNRTLQ